MSCGGVGAIVISRDVGSASACTMYFVSEPSGAHGVAKATARESGRCGPDRLLYCGDSIRALYTVQIEPNRTACLVCFSLDGARWSLDGILLLILLSSENAMWCCDC